jgi:hypothetical protein
MQHGLLLSNGWLATSSLGIVGSLNAKVIAEPAALKSTVGPKKNR